MSTRNTIDNILQYLKTINHKNLMEKEILVANKFPQFYKDKPFLVKKLCKGNDISMLYTMLDKIDDIQQNKISQTQVEMELGNDLANTYLSNINK